MLKLTASSESRQPLHDRAEWGTARLLAGFRQVLGIKKIYLDRSFLSLIVAVILFGALLAGLYGEEARFSVLVYPATATILAITLGGAWFILYALYTMLILRPVYPIRHVAKSMARGISAIGLVRMVVVIITFTLFLSAVSSLKSLIPAFDPFHWDPFLARLDASLYGGVEPWRWLQPLLGHPMVTRTINIAYNVWFFIMIGVLLWQMVDVRHPRRREQFLLMFVLIWVVNGLILATLLSSVGPCFYGLLLPNEPNPYAGLMAYLHHANTITPIWAVPTQDHLWDLYQKSALGIGSGISAMPSMHISMAWLLFLFARQVHRYAGWVMLAYVLVIMVGSVHLGWHYSIDGYVSIITTSLLWVGVSLWCRRR